MMKQAIFVLGLVFAGLLACYMGSKLSSDALSMAVGVVFGMLAGVPTLLLVLLSQRRHSDQDDEPPPYPDRYLPAQRQPYPYQPPVIVLAAPREEQQRSETHYHYHAPQSGPPAVAQRAAEIQRYQAQAPAQSGRVFRVVGECEEWTGGDDARR